PVGRTPRSSAAAAVRERRARAARSASNRLRGIETSSTAAVRGAAQATRVNVAGRRGGAYRGRATGGTSGRHPIRLPRADQTAGSDGLSDEGEGSRGRTSGQQPT